MFILFLDKMHLQKDTQYQIGKVVGVDSEGGLFKSAMTFMKKSLKQSHFLLKQYPR